MSGNLPQSGLRVALACVLLVALGLALRTSPAAAVALVGDRVALAGEHLEYLAEPAGGLSLDQILRGEAPPMRRSEARVPNFGFTGQAYWLRVELQAPPDGADWLLELSYPIIDEIELYQLRHGQLVATARSGDALPFAQRPISDPGFVFPLAFEGGAPLTLYLRVRSLAALQVPLVAWEERAFAEHVAATQMFWGAFYGTFVLMFLYNLCVYLLLRDRRYLWYIAYVASFLLYQMSLEGHAFQYLWPEQPWWANYSVPFFINTTVLAMLLFVRAFLDAPSRHPTLNKLLLAGAASSALLAPLSLLLPYGLSVQLSTLLGQLNAVLILFASGLSLRAGNRSARFLLLAWVLLLLGGLVYSLTVLGLLPVNALTMHVLHVGVALELVLLSFALADRMNAERRAKAEAQQRALVAEQQQRAAEARAEAGNLFLATMSHELRTPIHAVSGYSELALSSAPPPPFAEYFEQIHRAAGSLNVLVGDVLDLSRLEARRVELECVEYGVEELLRDVAHLFAHRQKHPRVVLTFSAQPELPRRLLGDVQRLKQILINLVGNALKFTERGEVRVSVCLLASREGMAEIEFNVADTGIGVSSEQAGQLFEPFSQADVSISRRYGGSGLGLSICKRLLELMGGSIGASERSGGGSVFWCRLEQRVAAASAYEPVTAEARVAVDVSSEVERDWLLARLGEFGFECLPAARADAVLISDGPVAGPARRRILLADADSAPAVKAGMLLRRPLNPLDLRAALHERQDAARVSRAVPSWSLSGARVLVVEDTAINRELAQAVLSRWRAFARFADDAEAALAVVQQEDFDCVLMDIQLPGMDGYEATRRIHALPGRQGLPVIAMTANAAVDEFDRCRAAGMVDYVPKPLELQRLYRTLTRWIAAPAEDGSGSIRREIDFAAVRKRLGATPEAMRSILHMFVQDYHDAAQQLLEATARDDLSGAAELAHGLCGAAAAVGAAELQGLAASLEQAARRGERGAVAGLSRALEAELEATLAALRAHLESVA